MRPSAGAPMVDGPTDGRTDSYRLTSITDAGVQSSGPGLEPIPLTSLSPLLEFRAHLGAIVTTTNRDAIIAALASIFRDVTIFSFCFLMPPSVNEDESRCS